MILNDLRVNITKVLNQSGLSIDVIYYVMKDIMNEVTSLYNQQLQLEREQNAAAAQESKEEVQEEQAVPSADIIEKEEN